MTDVLILNLILKRLSTSGDTEALQVLF